MWPETSRKFVATTAPDPSSANSIAALNFKPTESDRCIGDSRMMRSSIARRGLLVVYSKLFLNRISVTSRSESEAVLLPGDGSLMLFETVTEFASTPLAPAAITQFAV